MTSIVPDAPPPTIATGTSRSDFVIRPVLRIGGIGLAALDMVVDAGHGPARRIREPPGYRRVDDRRAARPDQLCADLHRARAVAGPSHPERSWMIDEKTLYRSAVSALGLVGRHGPARVNLWRPRQDSNLWPTD